MLNVVPKGCGFSEVGVLAKLGAGVPHHASISLQLSASEAPQSILLKGSTRP